MIPSSWNVLILLLSAATATAVAAAAEEDVPSPPSQAANGTTVYEILPKFGLPPGLLPNTVSSFSLAENGAFEVNLAGACYVEFEYLVYYEPKITGLISYGEISDLKGIQVRRFLLWFDVEAIKVDLPPSDSIYFDVGFITRKLSINQFKSVHSCRKKDLAGIVMEKAEDLYRLSEEAGMLITE